MERKPPKKESMIAKSKERSRAKRSLNRNFTSGNVQTNEHYLNRVGLRGRKRWVCLGVLVAVYLIAVAHLVLTCVILGVLRFTETGPSSFIFQNNGGLIWREGANITDVRLAKPSTIHAYNDQPLGFHGDKNNKIVFQSSSLGRTASTSQLKVTNSSVNFEPQDSLRLLSSATGDQLLFVNSTHTYIAGLTHLQSVHTTRTNTNRLQMRNESRIESSQRMTLRGAAGVSVSGSRIELVAGGNISLSAQTVLQLGGRDGVSLLTVQLPGATIDESRTTGHLCACNNGRLFVVPFNPRRCAAAVDDSLLVSLCTQ